MCLGHHSRNSIVLTSPFLIVWTLFSKTTYRIGIEAIILRNIIDAEWFNMHFVSSIVIIHIAIDSVLEQGGY